MRWNFKFETEFKLRHWKWSTRSLNLIHWKVSAGSPQKKKNKNTKKDGIPNESKKVPNQPNKKQKKERKPKAEKPFEGKTFKEVEPGSDSDWNSNETFRILQF